MNLPSFSQTVTDTSFVVLPEVIAREIARELILKDRLVSENTILLSRLEIKNELLNNKTQIVNRLEERIGALSQINLYREEQINNYEASINILQTQIRKERIQKNIYRATTGLAVIGAGAFYLTYTYYGQ